MTIEELRSALQATPFKPFEINLADGRFIPVAHPELVGHNPKNRSFAVVTPHGTEIVDLLLVTSFSVGNGSRGKPRKK